MKVVGLNDGTIYWKTLKINEKEAGVGRFLLKKRRGKQIGNGSDKSDTAI